jgi:hypothetical protein
MALRDPADIGRIGVIGHERELLSIQRTCRIEQIRLYEIKQEDERVATDR